MVAEDCFLAAGFGIPQFCDTVMPGAGEKPSIVRIGKGPDDALVRSESPGFLHR